ncbi:hypothetical protein HNY73_014160 [Argiope bruennichi]|uniref:Peptidase A2 domain-containing protein n=1 Tax=Argiope bruennichi TaxID=94029 RepID=A0A8T0ESB7_ARGBR|nr:hypothetical protein HNY73_014160 [Argiope bruennichi]
METPLQYNKICIYCELLLPSRPKQTATKTGAQAKPGAQDSPFQATKKLNRSALTVGLFLWSHSSNGMHYRGLPPVSEEIHLTFDAQYTADNPNHLYNDLPTLPRKALVDSGADYYVISKELRRQLNVY